MPFYCLILFFTIIYFVEGILTGQTFSAGIMLKSVAFGGTIIGNGWYLQVQLLLYLFFLATFSMAKDNSLRIILILGECLLYCVCLYVLGYSSTWFESVLAFPVGMLWREKEHRMINVNCNTLFYVVGAIEFTLFCVAFVGSYLVNNLVAALILKMASSLCFAVFVATAIHVIHIENRVSRWLGKYSMEIYLVQGLFLMLFHSEMINLENPYLYIFGVTASVLVAAVALHPITRIIYLIAREQ